MRTHHPGKTPSADQPGRTATPAAGLHAAISRSAVGDVPGGRGRPLAAPVTEGMGARLGGDFSHVPVYSGNAARAAAAEPGALVYTSGSHAVAGDGGADTHILALQRSIGNAAVSRMLQQAPHRHGVGGGHQWTAPPARVQRSAVHDVLASPGQPLPTPVQEEMQARLGADFSRVRVHTDAAARASAAEVGARAYTSGSHVVIGDGAADKHTLAHELTHVIQQRQGPVAGTDHGDGLRLSGPSDPFERAAESNAARVMSGPAEHVPPTSVGGLRRSVENHAPAQMPGRAPNAGSIQRVLKVGQLDGDAWQYNLDRNSPRAHGPRRDLMRDLEQHVAQRGFVMTTAAGRRVIEFIESDQHTRWFHDVGELVDWLFQEHLLDRPLRGPQLGPQSLSERPEFTGAAAGMAVPGQARRHVISSSTLGRAIENVALRPGMSGMSEQIRAFLGRHGVDDVPARSSEVASVRELARRAWKLVHNHVGNLWIGPIQNNAVRGFIRTPLQAERNRLRELDPDVRVTVDEIIRNLPPAGPGMLQAADLWQSIVQDLRAILQANSENGSIEPATAISVLAHVQTNADLDLPQQDDEYLRPHGNYLTDAITIYLELTQNPTMAIFEPDGALDRFMNLNLPNV